MKNFFKKFKKSVPSSLMTLLLLTSCATSAFGGINNETENDKDLTRVDFNEVLDKLTIGFEETYNDSVLVTDAIHNAKVLNQEVTVIIELDGESTVDTYLSERLDVTYPEFYGSKKDADGISFS